MEQLTMLWTNVVSLLVLVAPVVGITGGAKGIFRALFDYTPDIHIGPWTIKDGVWLSWSVSLVLVLLGNYAGWFMEAPDIIADPQGWVLAQWLVLSTAANYIYTNTYAEL